MLVVESGSMSVHCKILFVLGLKGFEINCHGASVGDLSEGKGPVLLKLNLKMDAGDS